MKRLLLILLATLFLAACSDSNHGELSVISGKWGREKVEKVYLHVLEKGELIELASSVISKDSTFYFALKPKNEGGFYFVAANKSAQNRFAFYFKPKDKSLNFSITEDSYVLTNHNSAENIELTKWHDFIQPLEWKSVYFNKGNSTYEDFFPVLEEKVKELDAYPKSATGNKEFDRAFEEYKKFNLINIAFHFIHTPRSVHPEVENYPDYYRSITLADVTKTIDVLDYVPSGTDLVERVILRDLRAEKADLQKPIDAILSKMPEIVNDTLRGELVAKFASIIRTFPGLLDYEEKYGKYLITDNQKEKLRVLKNTLNVMKDGAPAVDFKFPDANGKQIALSDFKGKLVYIDVWATWCGPCKQEIPYLKKLDEEYHNNKNIVFLSVSVDKSKDHAKWKEFLVKEGLKGVQIFAGDDSQKYILEPYKISGIPRFILVGKDGNIISNDAPRPSSSEIKILFKNLKI